MENQKNDNLNMLEAIVQNTEMGKNTLDQLVPMAEDEQFKAELLRQRNIYRQLNQEAHAAIDACGGSAQGQSAMAKLNTKVSIGMKTITDKSTRNLAEMLTQGSISARLRVDLSVRVFMLMPIFVLNFAMALWPWAVPPQASMAVWAS